MSDKSLSKKLPLLGGVLAVQVVIAGLLFWQDRGQDTVKVEPLLTLETGEIDRIEMLSDDKSLNLRRERGRWMLPEGLPVDEGKLTGLLDELGELRSGWPVANTDKAHERFKVADDNFRHRLNLFSKDQEAASLIVGTAPGFRQVHVRRAGDQDVYAVDLNAYVIEADAERWLDTALLQPAGDIERVAFDDFVVRKENGEWPMPESATTPAEGETAEAAPEDSAEDAADADTEAVATDSRPEARQPKFDAKAFAKALTEIRVLGLADKQAELDAPEAKANADDEGDQLVRFTVSVSTSEGSYTYELLSRGDNYYIRRGDFDATFRVSKPLYDRFDALRQLAAQANS